MNNISQFSELDYKSDQKKKLITEEILKIFTD